jgi:putative phage-type endonuclease
VGLTKEQLERRLRGLGGSDAAAVLGKSRFRSRFGLWLLKTGQVGDGPTSWDMRRGQAMEPEILAWYAEQMRCTLIPSNTMVHPGYPWMLAHLDAIATDGNEMWNVEVKAPISFGRQHWGEPWTADIDREYLPQVIHQMAVADLNRTDVVVSFGGAEPVIYRIYRDREAENLLISIEENFWTVCVVNGIQPEIDESDDAEAWLIQLYKTSSNRMLTGDVDTELEVSRRTKLNAEIKERKRDIKKIDNMFRAIIGSSFGIETPNWYVTWRPDKNGVRRLRYSYQGEDE